MPLPLFIGVTGGEIGVYLYALVARKREWKIEPSERFSSGVVALCHIRTPYLAPHMALSFRATVACGRVLTRTYP